jgi:hypothetical protein
VLQYLVLDEIKANLDKLEEVHERKMKETSEEMATLQDENWALKRQVGDQKDEIDLNKKQIKKPQETSKAGHLQASSNSLADEIETVNDEENKKNKRMDALKHLAVLGEKTSEEIRNLKNSLESLMVSKENPKTPNCTFGRDCIRLFCNFDHGFLFRNHKPKAPVTEETDENLTCEMCKHLLKVKVFLKKHMKTCTLEKNISKEVPKVHCDKCGNVFTSISKLRKHEQKEHSQELLECISCGKIFASEDELKEHVCQKVVQEEMLIVANSLDKLLENDTKENGINKINSKPSTSNGNQSGKKFKSQHRSKKTKNEEYYRKNIIIVTADVQCMNEESSELLKHETKTDYSDEEYSSEEVSSLSSDESETESSEIENGEVCSDIETP